MKITIVGSSHGVPEPDRKCSCIKVEIGGNIYFVDMGTPAIDEMRRRGDDVNAVKGVFITHMHGDHIGGLPAVLEAYKVGVLWHSHQTYYSDAYDQLLYYADQQDTLVEKPVVTQLFLLGDVQLELLGPLQKSYTDINNSSLVIMASYGKTASCSPVIWRHMQKSSW